MSTVLAVKIFLSLLATLFIAYLPRWMELGGDVRIRDEAHARALASEAVTGFRASEVIIDRAGIGALLKDKDGRQLLVRRHGAQFVGRLLTSSSNSRLDQNFLTIGTGEKSFGKVTLNLGDKAQHWASGLRHLQHG